MATEKHLKMKEDAHRTMLEKGIDEILSGQELMIEELHKLLARLEALEQTEKTPPVKKVDTRRKPK